MAPFVQSRLPQIHALCQRFGIQRLFVFGSAARGDDFNDKSDVDLLFRLLPEVHSLSWEQRPDLWAMKDAFETVFARPVDLVSISSVTNPYFIDKVNAEKVKIYEA